MKPENAIEISPPCSLSTICVAEAINMLAKQGEHENIYELRCASLSMLNALEIAEMYNMKNIGFFIKVTVDWDYLDCDEWSLRCEQATVWSAGP